MRILHILDHSLPLHSGYTFRTCAILKQQRALGWETFHLTSSKQGGDPVPEEWVDGFHFYRTPSLSPMVANIPVLKQVGVITALKRRLEEVLTDVKPDILHVHSPVLNAFAAISVGRRLGIPVVYEVRAFWEDAAVDHGTCREGGPRFRLTRYLETYALRKADAVTVICNGLRDDIARGISQDKITVIPNAVDTNAFSMQGERDAPLAQKLGFENKHVLGFIGSFYAYEGLCLLLQALPRVLSRAPDVRVLLVGGGPAESRLKRKAAEFGVEDKVFFIGRVPHAEVQRYYSLVDILVYPRYSMRLTEIVTPLKPLEAMAQGRLVLASDVGGHRELIQDGVTGILFKPHDSQDMAVKITDLLDHPERWENLRLAARRFVETERTWPLSVARYKKVYESLLRIKPYLWFIVTSMFFPEMYIPEM